MQLGQQAGPKVWALREHHDGHLCQREAEAVRQGHLQQIELVTESWNVNPLSLLAQLVQLGQQAGPKVWTLREDHDGHLCQWEAEAVRQGHLQTRHVSGTWCYMLEQLA